MSLNAKPRTPDARHPAQRPIIGILSGMGPHAGLDLARKIYDLTPACTDFEHRSVATLSYPSRIPDRSPFLLGQSDVNPAYALAKIALQLASVGAEVVGMPCNTAHAPPIFDVLVREVAAAGSQLRILHMIDETARALQETHPPGERIGILATRAVYELRLYGNALERTGFEPLHLPTGLHEPLVNQTIFDTGFGLKAQSDPVHPKARQNLLAAIDHLRQAGATAVILGCTELPLAVPEPAYQGITLVDPTIILARALLEATSEPRSKALNSSL